MTSRRALLGGLATLPLTTAAAAARPKRDRKRKPVIPHVDVAVIGAGAIGAWTAWHLVRNGRSVRLFDAYGVGHARAASGTGARTLDIAQGGDALYAPMAVDAAAQWATLSATASQPVWTPCGHLWVGPAGSMSVASLSALALGAETGDAAWLQSRVSALRFYQGDTGVLHSGAGVIHGGRAVQEVVADAGLAAEITVMPAPLKRPRDGKYQLPDGGTAGALVYACGAWLPEIFPKLLGPLIRVIRAETFYFGAGQGDRTLLPAALPAFVHDDQGTLVHGTPDVEGAGFALHRDVPGPRTDPDSMDRAASADGIAVARAWLTQRMPGLARAPVIGTHVSQYDRCADGDLLMDRLPGHERVWMIGGGAARGVALAPAIGKQAARLVLDAQTTAPPRFALPAKTPFV